jgi:hypothetical protein
VRFFHAGQVSVTAQISATAIADGSELAESSVPQSFDVTLASAQPDLSISLPAAGATIPVGEAGELVALRAHTSDQFGARTVTWECEGRSGPTTQSGTQRDVQVQLAALPLGARTIAVRCRDGGGNEATASVTVQAADVTAPRLEISQPRAVPDVLGGSGGVTVPVRGRASDGQSGMAGGEVGWSLTGGSPFTPATTADDWATWEADVPIGDFGTFTLDIRAADQAGSARTVRIPLQVVSSYRPRDLDERLDARSYLRGPARPGA